MPRFIRHSIFWLAIYLVWTYIRGNQTSYIIFFQVNFIQLIMYMAAYYTLRHGQIPHLLNRGRIFAFSLSILAMSIVLFGFWRGMGLLWLDDLRGFHNASLFKWSEYMLQTVQVYAPAMILLTWETYRDRQKEIERIHQLEKEKLVGELKFLKAQINPHFLFNTLNNLYSNVITKSASAGDMVLQLSNILDYALNKSQQATVPLSEEVGIIKNYLALEKIRYGDRLSVEHGVDADLSLPVSPLILLSLVENAFKHGASGDIDHPKIRIGIKSFRGEIRCEVWNTKSRYKGELNDSYKKGIGLKNIRRQLDLIYPDRHTLVIDDNVTSFNILLTIQTGAE